MKTKILILSIIVVSFFTFLTIIGIENENEVDNVAEVSFSEIGNTQDLYQLKEQLAKLQKDLDYMLNNLDSRNVTRINTNQTKISSADGYTKIDGNQLTMTDTTQPRLKMGYNKDTGLFEFILFDENGIKTFEVDSTGEAVFKGSITTEKDAYVGNIIYLGDQDVSNVVKGIYLNNNIVMASDVVGNFIVGNYAGNKKTYIYGGANQNGGGVVIAGTGQRLGFYGATPVVKPTLFYGGVPEVNNLLTALENLGLINVE